MVQFECLNVGSDSEHRAYILLEHNVCKGMSSYLLARNEEVGEVACKSFHAKRTRGRLDCVGVGHVLILAIDEMSAGASRNSTTTSVFSTNT